MDGSRWAAETTFSVFKRPYGENSMAKELAANAYICNTLINLEI
jgi:hypothetical protein